MPLVEIYEPWHYVFLKGIMEDSSVSSTRGSASGRAAIFIP